MAESRQCHVANGSSWAHDDFDPVTLVEAGNDIEEPLRTLLAIDEVTTVHVRAVRTQRFGCAVTR